MLPGALGPQVPWGQWFSERELSLPGPWSWYHGAHLRKQATETVATDGFGGTATPFPAKRSRRPTTFREARIDESHQPAPAQGIAAGRGAGATGRDPGILR